MIINQIRNATLVIEYAGKKILVDPMLSDKGTLPAFIPSKTWSFRKNPLNDLPISKEEIIKDVDFVFLSHLHYDHWDKEAENILPKNIKIFVQDQADQLTIEKLGFNNVEVLTESSSFGDIQLCRTKAQHGKGYILKIAGLVCGLVLKHPAEETLYIAADTVWYEGVQEAIDQHKPKVVVLNGGDNQFAFGGQVIMNKEDIFKVHQAIPQATLIISHMEGVNHFRLTKKDLKEFLKEKGIIDKVKVPEDGESYSFFNVNIKNQDKMKILVFGATGSQQFNVIGEANKKGAEVIAATSSEKSFDKLKAAGATPVLGDLSDVARMNEITKGIDAIAFMIPVSLPNPFDGLVYAKNVIDAAKANDVKKIVWNTSGWLPDQKIGVPTDDVKLDIKEYLVNSGLEYVIIEPTIYMENIMGGFCAPFIINEKKLAYPTPEAMPIGWIASKDVSAFVVEAIFNADLKGDTFQISGLENLKGNDLADRFSKGFGENIVYYAQPPQEFKDILAPYVGEAGASAVASYYESLKTVTEYPAKFNPDMNKILEKLPVKMTSLEEWARDNKGYFTK